jgi:hypothetical protein
MRLCHIDIQQHWLQEMVQDGKINIKWVPTSKMVANGLTKPLSSDAHKKFVKMLGLQDIRT